MAVGFRGLVSDLLFGCFALSFVGSLLSLGLRFTSSVWIRSCPVFRKDHDILRRTIMRRTDERGASMLEYALLAALIAVVCISAVTVLGRQASISFSKVGSSLS